jgi:hypothetical protein
MAKLGEALEAADKDFLSWLFREMRNQRVLVLKFKGLEIQLAAEARPDPTKAELEAIKKIAEMVPAPTRPDTMPPELAGPLAAASIMAGEAPPPWMRAGSVQTEAKPQQWADPTDPERDIDDNELMGANLPVDH